MADERTADEVSALEQIRAAQAQHAQELESVVGISAHIGRVREAEEKARLARLDLMDKRSHKKDIALGVVRGVSGAFEEGADLVATLQEEDKRMFGALDLNPFDAPEGTKWWKTFGYISPSKVREGEKAGTLKVRADVARAVETGWGLILDSMPEVERASGGFVEPMAKFITGFVVGKKALKGASLLQGAGRAAGFGSATVAGAIADVSVFDGQEERLSNLIQSSAAEGGFPDISNEVAEFLAADEEDPELVGRMKALLEGGAIGSLFDGFLAALRGIKHVRRLQAIKKAEKKALAGRTPLADHKLPEEALAEADEVVTHSDTAKKLGYSDELAQDANKMRRADVVEAAEELGVSAKGSRATIAARIQKKVRELDDAASDARQAADEAKAAKEADPEGFAKAEIETRKSASEAEVSRTMTITDAQRIAFRKAVAEGDEDAASVVLKDFNEKNIDWEKITDAEDIKNVMAATEKIFYELIDKTKGGVQTNEQTKRLANMVDASSKEIGNLFRDVRGGTKAQRQQGIAARFYSAQRVMLASAEEVKRTAQASIDNPGSAKHEAAALRQLQVHAAIQAEVKGAQTEIARALQGMGMIKDAAADNFKAFDDLRSQFRTTGGQSTKAWQDKMDEILSTADLQSLNRMTQMTGWDRVTSIFVEYTINSMLSSPKTHVINFVSNVLNTGLYSMDRTLGGAWRYMRHGDKQAWREARIDWYSKTHRMGEAAKLARQAWKDGAPVTDARQRIEFKTRTAIGREGTQRPTHLWEDQPATRAELEKAPDLGARVIAQKTEVVRNDLGEITSVVDHSFLDRVVNTIGRVVRIPGRGLITGDEFFKAINRNAEISVQAFRQADEEALAKGLDYGTDAYESFVTKRTNKLGDVNIKDVENLEIQKIARDKARLVTFQENPKSNFGSKAESLMNSNVFVKLVFAPFFRTPMNILRQGIFDRTPLGRIFKQTRQTLATGHAREVAETQARMYTGMAFMSAFAFGTDADEDDGGFQVIGKVPYGTSAKDANIKDYSMRLGNRWFQFNRLEPFGMWLGLVADIKTTMKYHDGNDDLVFALGQAAMGSFLNNVTNKTFMTSMTEFQNLLEAVKTGRQSTIERGVAQWSAGQMGKLIPQFYKGTMAALEGEDRFAQEAWTLLDILSQRSATFNGDLRDKHDNLGRPIDRDGGLSILLNPFSLSENSDDPVDQEFFRLGFQLDPMEKTLGGTFELTAEEYAKLTGLVADTGIHKILTALIESEGYQKLTDPHKKILLKEQVMNARVSARAIFLGEGDIARRLAQHDVDASMLIYKPNQ